MSKARRSTRRGSFASAIASTVAISASGFGRLTSMFVGLRGDRGGARRRSRRPRPSPRRSGLASMSKPITCQPAALEVLRDRAAHDAEADDADLPLGLGFAHDVSRARVLRACGRSTDTAEGAHANRNCRARPHGRSDGGAADGCRPHAHGLESHARESKAARPMRARSWSATPEDLAEHSEALITMLTDADAIDHVYNGEHGLLAGDVHDKLFIEMSTVRPDVQIALAKVVRASGARFVECPVGGTTGPARQGKLFGFMGAERGRRGACEADPRSALPAARACRAGRQRRARQVHHQHAADDLLPGARRGARDGASASGSSRSG